MRFKKLAAAALAAILTIGGAGVVHATNFHDVGENWAWARPAIEQVAELGIMSGNLAGNFRPGDMIDKFETSRILSRMAGFNPLTHSPAERAYFEAVNANAAPTIAVFAEQFSRWNSAFNSDIAFLLYRGILTPADLERFVVVDNNVERLRALSREEVAVFLVRIKDRSDAARALTGITPFADDHLINADKRVYVNYLRHVGIMIGADGHVNPRGHVNRAAMAMLIVNTLEHIDSPLIDGGGQNQPPAPIFQTVVGTITGTYPTFSSILVTSANADHNNRVFPFANNPIITVNGATGNFAALSRYMSFTATVMDGEIISINATGGGTPPGTTAPTAPPTAAPTQPNQANQNLRTLDGTVARVNFIANPSTIGIETRMISPRGEIITEIRDYAIAPGAIVTRAGANASYRTIIVGDLIVAQVQNNTAHSIQLQERDREMRGTLIEKTQLAGSQFPALVLRDSDGIYHSFNVNSDTRISRRNMGAIAPRELRLGDSVELRATWGVATEIFAYGIRSSLDVYIRSIFISSREQSFIVGSETAFGAGDRQFFIVDGALDAQTLAIGSRVRLFLDSWEIESVTLLANAASHSAIGHITAINTATSSITVRDGNFNTRTFQFDHQTVFYNSVTAQLVHFNTLTQGMRVYVVTATAAAPNRATSIVILPN